MGLFLVLFKYASTALWSLQDAHMDVHILWHMPPERNCNTGVKKVLIAFIVTER